MPRRRLSRSEIQKRRKQIQRSRGLTQYDNGYADITDRSVQGGGSSRMISGHNFVPDKHLTSKENYDRLVRENQLNNPNRRGKHFDIDKASASNDRSQNRTPGSRCRFKCFGVEVMVAPGDCIRCPEAAYCPDNVYCSQDINVNQGFWEFVDRGYACCGCAYDHDGTGELYGQPLGWTYGLWVHDTYCDDSDYEQTYYQCQRKVCGNPAHQENDWMSGPNHCSDWNGMEDYNPYEMCHSMFYWADEQPDYLNQYYGDIATAPPGKYGFGSIGAGLACPEWGMDCGDIGAHGYNFCYMHGSGIDTSALTGTIRACDGDPTCWVDMDASDIRRLQEIGYDTNQHCNHKAGLGATCAHKCNRPRYNNPDALGSYTGADYAALVNVHPFYGDPGGFAFTADWNADDSPGTCGCDFSCPYCGCDPILFEGWNTSGTGFSSGDGYEAIDSAFALNLFEDCLRDCGNYAAPTDCGPHNILVWYQNNAYESTNDGSFPIITQHGQVISGTQVGVDCHTPQSPSQGNNNNLGDCCNDYRQQCTVPRPELPCECFAEGETIDFQLDIALDCQYTNGNDCIYSGPIIYGNSCSQDCQRHCQNMDSRMNPDAWDALWPDLDNYACMIINYNEEVLDEPNSNYWVASPVCDAYSSYNNVYNNTCQCECKCLDESDLDQFIDFGPTPQVGCTDQNACNYDPAALCLKESIGAHPDTGYDWVSHPAVVDANFCRGWSSPNYLGSPQFNISNFWEEDKIPPRIIKWWTGYWAWTTSGCSNAQIVDYINGNHNTCNAALELWNTWWDRFTTTSTCYGCPDPYAENYTGGWIHRDVGQTQWDYDCSGTGIKFIKGLWTAPGVYNNGNSPVDDIHNPDGVQPDVSCCVYARGCGDDLAINYLEANETNGYVRGGYGWPALCQNPDIDCSGPPGTDYGNTVGAITAVQWCKLIQAQTFSGDRFDCFDISQFIENNYWELDDAVARNYVYSYAPFGNDYGSNLSQTGEHPSFCSYDVIDYCADQDDCNWSQSCTSGEGDASCGAGFGFTCVGNPAEIVQCGQPNANACVSRTPYCPDTDGDGLDDGDTTGIYGCDMTGELFDGYNATLGPNDSYQNGPTCANCWAINTTPSIDYPNTDYPIYLLTGTGVESTYENGFPLVMCSEYSGIISDPVSECVTNMTHASQGDGNRYCSGNITPTTYHNGSYGPVDFSVNDCCTRGGCCESDPNCPGEIISSGGQDIEVPCCYRDDDTGNCKMPNTGYFVLWSDGVIQTANTSATAVPFQHQSDSLGGAGCDSSQLVIADEDFIFTYDINTFGTVQGVVCMQPHHSYGDVSNGCFCLSPIDNQIAGHLDCHCNLTDNIDGYDYYINQGYSCGGTEIYDCENTCGGDAVQLDCPGVDCGYDIPAGNCDCNGNVEDCNGECGGTAVFAYFRQDLDCDLFCNNSTLEAACVELDDFTTWPGYDGQTCSSEGYQGSYKFAETGAIAGYIAPNLPGSVCEGTNDIDNDENFCVENVTDDCGVCITGGHVPNSDQDCAGVCFGEAFLDDCGVCSGGNTGHSPNSDMDQCGLCDPNTDGISSRSYVDPFGISFNINFGSFGCLISDWSNNSGFSDETNCESPYCGCQCSGCTNMFSPIWDPWATYDQGWAPGSGNMGEDLSIIGWPNYSGENYCWNHLNYHLNNLSRRTFDWLYFKYSDYCNTYSADDPDWGRICTLEENPAICIDSNGAIVECSSTMSDFNVPINSLLNWYNYEQYDAWFWHGELRWYYCDNNTLDPSANDGTCDPDLWSDDCVANFGQYCCGVLSNKEHCRVGDRSDLWWWLDRPESATDETITWPIQEQGFGMGDLNFDGLVNVQDIIILINHIVFDTPLTGQQFLSADINQDGIINILDVVSLVNLILNDRGSVASGDDRTINAIIRNLMPLFNNSLHSRMMLVDNFGNPLRSNNTVNPGLITDPNNTRSNYNLKFFSFLFNSPYCWPMDGGSQSGFDESIFEIGEYFSTQFGGSLQVINFDGLPAFSAVPGDLTNYNLNVETNNNYHVLSVYHPEVKIQSSPLFKPIGTAFPGNAFVYDPPGADEMLYYCSSQYGDYIEMCEDLSVEDCTDTDLNEWASRCSVYNTSMPLYYQRGIFGFDMLEFSVGDHSFVPTDANYWWLPGYQDNEDCIEGPAGSVE